MLFRTIMVVNWLIVIGCSMKPTEHLLLGLVMINGSTVHRKDDENTAKAVRDETFEEHENGTR